MSRSVGPTRTQLCSSCSQLHTEFLNGLISGRCDNFHRTVRRYNPEGNTDRTLLITWKLIRSSSTPRTFCIRGDLQTEFLAEENHFTHHHRVSGLCPSSRILFILITFKQRLDRHGTFVSETTRTVLKQKWIIRDLTKRNEICVITIVFKYYGWLPLGYDRVLLENSHKYFRNINWFDLLGQSVTYQNILCHTRENWSIEVKLPLWLWTQIDEI
jgi:hypothetical protein